MASTFDNLYLPGGDEMLFGSQDEVNFDDYADASFTAVNANMSYPAHTVSPTELMNPATLMSAPASAAFATLHTPASSYLESPAMGSSSYNTSPLETLDSNLDYTELDNCAPLFPQDGSDQFAHAMPLTNPMQSMSFGSTQSMSKTSSSSSLPSPMVRQKSSPGRPPSSGSLHLRKHSLTHGIAKPGKSRKNLTEITIDETDSKEVAKRKKNTAAARKSRQRKQETQEALEAEIARLRGIVVRMGGNPDDEEYDQD